MFTPRENRCRRFQANYFNKRKCQNCFRPVDSHTLDLSEFHAANPVKSGWLLLAPEGIDFLNPAHKNRKWQRRYFVLDRHGLLCYALDEMPGTIPHGSVNINQCSDILDASSQTSFGNTLRLCFSDRDYYIRMENAEDITGWQECLLVHLSTTKSNQKKRRREQALPMHNLKKHAVSENNPVSDSSINNYILNTNRGGSGSRSTTKKRSLNSRTADSTGDPNTRSRTEDLSVSRNGNKDTSGCGAGGAEVGCPLPSSPEAGLLEEPEELSGKRGRSSSRMSHDNSPHTSSVSSYLFSTTLNQVPAHFSTNATNCEGAECGYSPLKKTRSDAEDIQSGPDQDHRRSQVISQFEQDHGIPMPATEPCSFSSLSTCSAEEYDQDTRANQGTTWAFALGHGESGVYTSTCRRSKSLERNLAEHTPTPDFINLKKGWMKRLGEDGKWRKHWFVLVNQSLRFYRDSVAEEAADMDGEISLSTCYDITDFPVQSNYGFQIHTKDGVYTLCAVTFLIRQNWIQALMKNIQPSAAPDVTCSVPQNVSVGMVSESKCSFALISSCSEEKKKRSISDRCREGHYKTFDWADLWKKREPPRRQSEIESEFVCDDSVPPAPASTPEEPLASSTLMERAEMSEGLQFLKPASSSTLMVGSSVVSSKPSDRKSAEVDGVDVFKDIRNVQMEEKKETDLYTSPAMFSSLSVQTECQWELERQTLQKELKAMYERSEKEGREFKLTEARLQTELRGTVECLHETESKLQKTEATLREREHALEESRCCIEDLSGRLQATEEAQALKDVRLQRHLRLLEESQEKERRSLSDSLELAENRGKELEKQLTEARLQKMPTEGIVEQLERKCQELQNQLDESDSELSRLQGRLQNEETLYYDMEHKYEQVCEELEFVRGTLKNCERVCEERFRIQLEQQQEKLNRKERELQQVFLKMGCCDVTLELTEHIWLKDTNCHLQESQNTVENINNFGFGDLQKVAQGDESQQVISVIQTLESKLCDTEERLQKITMHLQQQQKKLEVNPVKVVDHWSVQLPSESLGPGMSKGNPDGKDCGIILEKPSTNANVNLDTNEMLNMDLQDALHEECTSPEKQFSQGMTSRMLSLEAIVIQKMASALEHPSKHLLEGLSQLHAQIQAVKEAYDGGLDGTVIRNYSQLFLCYQELGELAVGSLDEHEICSMCMIAELAYLMYTTHESQTFNVSFNIGSEIKPLQNSSKKGGQPDVSRPELVPGKEQMQSEKAGFCLGDLDKDSLVVELKAQASSLEALTKQLHPLDRNADALSELTPVFLQPVLFHAILAYMASRLHVTLQQKMPKQPVCQCHRLETLLQEQAEHYEEKLRENCVLLEVAKLACVSAETDAQIKGQELHQLDLAFEKKIQELQQIHEEELNRLHGYYTQSQPQNVTATASSNGKLSESTMKERIRELELQIRCLEDELHKGDANTLRQTYEEDLLTLKVTCELGFRSMEQSHQRVIEEMQRQHQIEVEQLLEEKERVLQEETNATIAAIEAMRKAHKEELKKSQKTQQNGANTDISKLRDQFKDELDSLHRELEVLSEQYSQKCLENAHLSRAIEAERQALSSVERENQELHTRNQELNKCLVAELSLMQSCVNGGVDQAELSQGKDMIQLEVALRVKESEIQCLKQEISSLKEELQAANRHRKKLLNESSVSGIKCQTSCVRRSAETCRQTQSYEVMKSRSNPDFLKSRTKPSPPVRSKSLRERISVQDRMKLFETDIK